MSLMALLAAGCSSDEITVNNGGENGGNVKGTSYVALNVVLPTTNGSRTTENGNFNPGTPDEYNVTSLKVTYFTDATGTTEKYQKTYTAAQLQWDKGATDITTTAVLPVDELNESGTFYALVEVNNNASLTVNQTAQSATVAQLIGASKNQFFMTNTVQKDGSYLVPVQTYPTKDEATKKAKAIYVERAVAKVELDKGWTGDAYTIPDGKVNAGAKVKATAWKLDNTNTKLFPVRKFAGIGTNTGQYAEADYARFFDNTRNYRTFWAEDPNYSTDASAELVKVTTTQITNALGTTPEYCLENTFNTAMQTHKQTTRALLKASYQPKNFTEGETWYTLGNATTPLHETDVEAKIAKELGVEDATKIQLATLTAGKDKVFTTAYFTNGGSTPSIEDVKKIQKALGKITVYVNGVCYYEIRIKHLDYYCPWGDETIAKGWIKDAPSFGTPATTYVDYTTGTEDMEKAYLGRYSVVRNNWYKITVNTISQPGTPTIPELTDDPDDEQKYYLQASINILDWAVRTQGVDL